MIDRITSSLERKYIGGGYCLVRCFYVTVRYATIITYTSYIDLHLDIDCDDPLRSEFYDNRDYFNISIVSSLFIYLNI
jgi:hypothetical protein